MEDPLLQSTNSPISLFGSASQRHPSSFASYTPLMRCLYVTAISPEFQSRKHLRRHDTPPRRQAMISSRRSL